MYFNPLRPWGRRLCPESVIKVRYMISTHSARGGGDNGQDVAWDGWINFNPLRPWGRRRGHRVRTPIRHRFQPTPPVGAETRDPHRGGGRAEISTHSARGGGDLTGRANTGRSSDFNPLRPWGRRLTSFMAGAAAVNFNPLRPWGRRPGVRCPWRFANLFQPTPPVGAETLTLDGLPDGPQISTHSARGGGDTTPAPPRPRSRNFNPLRPWGRRRKVQRTAYQAERISTHSARGGGDEQDQSVRKRRILFQPTPPVGAETGVFSSVGSWFSISTHSARGGGDSGTPGTRPVTSYFNPLRPWGRRPGQETHAVRGSQFQPTPPVGAETGYGLRARDAPRISTHSARGGGDGRGKDRMSGTKQFQPTPPVGAETSGPRGLKLVLFQFQPTPPVGAETCLTDFLGGNNDISTHSARGGGDRAWPCCSITRSISTHSARGGGDSDGGDGHWT